MNVLLNKKNEKDESFKNAGNEAKLVFLDAGTIGNDIQWPDFASLGEIVTYETTPPELVADRISDAEFLLTNKVVITSEHIANAKSLRYIGTIATGYNQVDIGAAAARGIPVCNVPDYSSTTVMQHVFTLLLSLTSQACELARSVRNGDWSKSPHFSYWFRPITELSGKTMGIVGFGDIGAKVGFPAHSFGMKVLAYAPRPKPEPDYAPFAFAGLDELFGEADVLTLHCPLTEETRGMINARSLGKMKNTAYLINTARGPLVNEADLCRALEQGEIAGAGLDVVSEEPMPDSNPLRLAPNCIITPHVAWASVEARERLMQGVFNNIKSFMNGSPENVKNGVQG